MKFQKTLIFKLMQRLFLFSIVVMALSVPTCSWGQQPTNISGKIIDESGNPINEVSVRVNGKILGTTTNALGEFTIKAMPGDVLVFSHLSFLSTERLIRNTNNISITMASNAENLGDVVVVGYGTTRKKDLTGSVATIRAKDLPQVANTSVNQMIQGRAAGITLNQRSAQPGAGVSVNIRGAISPLGNNVPLYVIDGVPITNNWSPLPGLSDKDLGYYGGVDQDPLNTISPSDIESIDILKDASATAIYGSAAANGVVLITTRKGKVGKVSVEYRGSYTVQTPKKYLDFLNAKQFMEQYERFGKELHLFRNKIAPYGNTDPSAVAPYIPRFTQAEINSAGEGTDWISLLMRNGMITEHNVSTSGGTESTKIYTALNFYNNKGLLKNSDFTRFSGRINLEQQWGKRVKFVMNTTISEIKNKNASTGGNSGGAEKFNMLQAAYSFAPTIGVYDEKANFSRSYNRQITNPVAFLSIKDQSNITRIFTAPTVEVKILDALKFNIAGGIDKQISQRNFYLPIKVQNYQLPEGAAQLSTNSVDNFSTETYLTYSNFWKSHSLTALAGAGYYKSGAVGNGLQAVGFFSDAFEDYNIAVASARDKTILNSYKTEKTKISQFFRLNYAFKSKYILTLTGRRDGSSVFADNKKYGFFPGASAAWRISDEPFMKKISHVNDLKFRVSYGASGNESVLGTNSISLYGTGFPYLIGNTVYNGLALSQIGNPNLTWETDYTFNAGINAGLFNNRVVITYDYFRKTAKDLLDFNKLPSNNAIGLIASNVGTTRSVGHEFSISTKNTTGALIWNTLLNAATYNSYWVERNPQVALAPYIGKNDPLNAIYGWKTNGIVNSTNAKPSFMPDALPGNVIYVDNNKDGNLDIKDVVILGRYEPRWSFGFGNIFAYKGFDLNIFLYGVLKNKIYNQNFWFVRPVEGTTPGNSLKGITNIWTSDNTAGIYPGIATNKYDGYNPTWTNDFNLQDGSFARIKNITMGYRLSENLFGKENFIKNARLFVDFQNVAVLTKYKGFDPEYQEANPYPQALSSTIGVNINF